MADKETPKRGGKTPDTDYIRLKVKGPDGSVVLCKLRREAPLGKLFRVYCRNHGLSVSEHTFRSNGQTIKPSDTAAMLKMQDGHRIEVFQQKTGGAS